MYLVRVETHTGATTVVETRTLIGIALRFVLTAKAVVDSVTTQVYR
jgi:hypothetical protein